MCGCLSHAPHWGPGLQPWSELEIECALTGNRTGGPLAPRFTLNPLNYTSQGLELFLKLNS